MADPSILSLLGLARKAGQLVTGEEPVGAACRARRAKLVLVASDAADNTVRRADHFCRTGNAPLLPLPFTKLELGLRLSRGPCAILALTDAGFAATTAERLSVLNPDCASVAAELRLRANRVLERQQEQKRHEKNLRKGKRPPWAPPPPSGDPPSRPRGGRKPPSASSGIATRSRSPGSRPSRRNRRP